MTVHQFAHTPWDVVEADIARRLTPPRLKALARMLRNHKPIAFSYVCGALSLNAAALRRLPPHAIALRTGLPLDSCEVFLEAFDAAA
jgi:hypothetical protein